MAAVRCQQNSPCVCSFFSVFKLEVITPLGSFVSDASDPTLRYSDIADFDTSMCVESEYSHALHVFICPEIEVCLLCHYSIPAMLKPLSAFFDVVLSRLQCARFAVLSVVDPHAPLLSHAVTVSVSALDVRAYLFQ